jgi:hypothetical protein
MDPARTSRTEVPAAYSCRIHRDACPVERETP